MGPTLRLRLPVRSTDEQVRGLCAWLREQLRAGTVTAVVCRVDRPSCDLATVDAVARLALVARRGGVAFRLERPGAELASLLGLAGLGPVLAGPSPGCPAQATGEQERGESRSEAASACTVSTRRGAHSTARGGVS